MSTPQRRKFDRILVTGAAGFIGSNFVDHMQSHHPDSEIIALDSLTYAGNMENLATADAGERFTFVRGDISSPTDVQAAFAQYSPDAVINFAAETHVDRSLMDVASFIQTNIFGTQVLLDACGKHGVERFVQVSTDEVYGTLGPDGRFTEQSPITPNNPYSATKASADLLVRAAHESYGLDVVITRCSNNFGPRQFPEKLIPLVIANALEDKPLPIYGDGMQVRDWIYVADHCAAIGAVLTDGLPGAAYNIGGDHDVANLVVVKAILGILGKPESLIRHVTDRPGHDRRYAMDCAYLQDSLGWAPKHSFEQALQGTVDWYLANADWCERVKSGDYMHYYERMYGNRLRETEDNGSPEPA
jgi:dTDP-glucose 4,6-dehydratase